MKTILVLFGGRSTEYGVSLQSAHAVLSNLDRSRYRPLMVGITRQGRWLHYSGPLDRLEDDTWHEDCCVSCALSPDFGTPQLLLLDGSHRRLDFDAAFPVLHGKNGEDGTVQGLLELTGAPLIGCGCLSSALCMDKDRAHKLARLAGVLVPRSALFRQGAPLSAMEEAAARLGYPLFVKPVRAGSSFGVTRVTAPDQLGEAVADAFANDRELLLEEAIDGFEVGCAVLGNQDLTVGLVDEIELTRGFFDFEEKYTLKTSAIHCPARITPEQAARVQEAARIIYRALDCRVFARVDLFLTSDGRVVFNEVNTIPGFTSHSRYPNMMKGIGLDFPALLTRIIETGVGA
ncbi:D-alanine--D-serine ligase VanG [uncultured Flavonifractor sp.]|uniref:D-alanine--D-serine ligase VanG n=1 Tax=uncultured Flavonifractor sp. TaxID=1193534 RepID=UPI00261BB5B2|nr:D-alanine--D-serine ligase VanG [uncultured Flavonifractor sp.]